MRQLLSVCAIGVFITILFTSCAEGAAENRHAVTRRPAVSPAEQVSLHNHALEVKKFIQQHHFNSRFCFLIDMSKPSGNNRFFVYNLSGDSVEMQGLVAHGCCNTLFLRGRKYSNTNGSGCSSLGRYRIGEAYKGQYGHAYRLYGMDATNNNAYNRHVVLHSYDCVPDKEIAPQELCQSYGCPMVSPLFLSRLAKKLDASSKPVLLYIYQ